ncbi:MAG: hypothetical protein RL264_2878 [Bacteroidota bacterium]|jgi:hypothetical protein
MKNLHTVISIVGYVLGGVGGYIYYLLFPCETGCSINRTPLASVLMGAFVGGLIAQAVTLFINSSKS